MPDFPSRRVLILLVVLTGLGLLLRIQGLGALPITGDEAMHLLPMGLWETIRQDLSFNPPLFRFLVWLTTTISPTVQGGRSVSVLAGVAAIPLMFLLGRRFLRNETAMASALLLAIHPWHIRYCQELRSYALFVTLAIASGWLWARFKERPTRRRGCALATALVLLVSTHYLAALILLGLAVAEVLDARQWRRLWPYLPGAALLLPYSLAVLAGVDGKTEAQVLIPFVNGATLLFEFLHNSIVSGGVAGLAASIFVLAGLDHPVLPKIALAAGVYLATVALLALWIPVELRYMLPGLVAALWLLAAGVERLWTAQSVAAKPWARGFVGALTLLVVAGIVYGPLRDDIQRPDYRRGVHGIHELAQSIDSNAQAVLLARGRTVLALYVQAHDGRVPQDTVVQSTDDAFVIQGGGLTLMRPTLPQSQAGPSEFVQDALATMDSWRPDSKFLLLVPGEEVLRQAQDDTTGSSSQYWRILDCPAKEEPK